MNVSVQNNPVILCISYITNTVFPLQNLLKAEEHSWSLAELIHAVVLLTHYHSLASFTFGCGITPDIHCEGGHTFRPPSLSQYCVCDIANGNGHANHHDDLFGNEVSRLVVRTVPC